MEFTRTVTPEKAEWRYKRLRIQAAMGELRIPLETIGDLYQPENVLAAPVQGQGSRLFLALFQCEPPADVTFASLSRSDASLVACSFDRPSALFEAIRTRAWFRVREPGESFLHGLELVFPLLNGASMTTAASLRSR